MRIVIGGKAGGAVRFGFPGLARTVVVFTACGTETGVIAVSGDEHERAGLAVGRACGMNEYAHGDGIACGAFSIEQRKKRTE